MLGDSKPFLAASGDLKMLQEGFTNSLSDSLTAGSSIMGYQFPALLAIVSCNEAS